MSPGPQTELERRVVGALLLPPTAGPAEKTVAAIATRAGLSEADVRRTLRQLEQLDPPLVHHDQEAVLGIEFWIALDPATDGLD